jgi:hypothetical protein
MSFISTYNSLSVRGWKNSEPVGANLQLQQTINSVVVANNVGFGRFLSCSNDGNYLAISPSGATNSFVFFNSAGSFINQFQIDNFRTMINGNGDVLIGYKDYDIGNLTAVGSVPVYSRVSTTWSLQQTIIPSVYIGFDNFGILNATNQSGNTIVAYATTGGSHGSVFTFVGSPGSYTETQQILLPGPSRPSIQDRSIGLSGDGNYFIIGCSSDGTPGPSTYADIYIKSGNTFSYQSTLQPSDTAAGDDFGISVSLNYDGSIALIGASQNNGNAGAAYTFIRSGTSWSQQQKLISNKASANDFFGISSFISSDSSAIIIGAIAEDTGGLNRGSAFIYFNVNNNFYLSQELTGAANTDVFGQGTVISNQPTYVASIGAQGADISPRTNVGKVYVYTGTA